jgi:hypothetical protein
MASASRSGFGSQGASTPPPPPPPPPSSSGSHMVDSINAAGRRAMGKTEKASGKKNKKSLEKGNVKSIKKPKNIADIKTDLASPAGKKYEEMSYGELSSHVAGLFGGEKKEEKPKKAPGALAASESARELEKGDVIDFKTKTKTPGPKPEQPAKKPDTRNRDQKINDALAAQGAKGSPYASARESTGVSNSQPKKPSSLPELFGDKESEKIKPTTAKEMRKEKFLEEYKQKQQKASQDFINNMASANKPKAPANLKIIKSLEAIMPKFEQGMSMEDLKKAEEKYNIIKNKIESLIKTGNPDLIEKALEKLKNI